MKRLLLTGASGTLGYNVTRKFAALHPDVSVVVAMRRPQPEFFADLANVEIVRWDMIDKRRTAEIVRDLAPDAIVHCAAEGVRPMAADIFDVVKSNVDSTLELFRESCRLARCHFVHVSTGFVYSAQGRPLRENDPIDTLHPYGASKAAADTLLRATAFRLERHLTVVRPFSFTGIHDGGDRLFPSLLRCAHENLPFAMSSGKQVRDYCAVDDVVDAIVLILRSADAPCVDVFNIGSGSRITLRDLVEEVVSQLGIDVRLEFGRLANRGPESIHHVADIRHAQKHLGWHPRTSVAQAVWELGHATYPNLPLRKPMEITWRYQAASR